jgi:hypothetical protein
MLDNRRSHLRVTAVHHLVKPTGPSSTFKVRGKVSVTRFLVRRHFNDETPLASAKRFFIMFSAVTMVNGMTVNGLGEVSAMSDVTGVNNSNSSLLGLGKQLTHYLILGTQLLPRLSRYGSPSPTAPPFSFLSFPPIKAS